MREGERVSRDQSLHKLQVICHLLSPLRQVSSVGRALVPAMVPGVGGSNPLLGSKRSDALSISLFLCDASERRGWAV